MNSVEAPIESAHLAPGAVVCDLSIPASVNPELSAHRPDVRIILGGLAALPFAEDLRITGFPRPAGQVYACMAEAMILGFERRRDRWFTGSLSPDHVTHIARLANHHGFTLAAYKETGVLGSHHHEPAFTITR
jgi:predicted amino acid dehydrogenase